MFLPHSHIYALIGVVTPGTVGYRYDKYGVKTLIDVTVTSFYIQVTP